MSAADNRAVFLSYASQDAEIALRICEALRTAGVEVWFDQNELTGGDAWDQKIRNQIKACTLFVPVISAATNARREGYFRREWKIAVDRTHDMDEALPFLVPVVIDDTTDAGAFVPEKFREVQWTRLPRGETPDKFCTRVKRLLDGSTVGGALRPDEIGAAAESGRKAPPTTGRRGSPWLVPAVLALAAIVALAVWRPWRNADARFPAGAAAPVLSEASRLVAKAWEQMDKTEMARNELQFAEGYCRQAAALEETNPAVWAAWSAMNTWYYFHQFERLPARKEAARDYAQKALALDPKSYEARYAWGHFIVRMAAEGKIGDEKPALPILRELLRERPDEPRALYALGWGLICDPANVDEGFAVLEHLAKKHPWFAGRALNEVGWMALFHGRFGLAESAADRALQAQPYWNNLGLKATLALRLHGDVDLAQATINRLPPTALQENWGISLAVTVADWRGDHERAIAILQGVSRDWLENFFYYGPTSFLSGWNRVKAKQATAAEKDFRRALELIALRLEKTPNDAPLLSYKAEALRLLGMREEAEKTYRHLREVWPSTNAQLTFEAPEQALDYVRQRVRLGYKIEEFPPGWWFTAASLRKDPMLENVRRAPGFPAVLEEAEQQDRQRWTQTSATSAPKTVAAPPAESEKSVAVLAFKNVGGDAANDAIVEGIGFELISVLGRVPGLTVRGNSSLSYFKGSTETAAEKGRKLDAAYLVDGSVQRAGDTLRIAANLTRAASNEIVWSTPPLNRDVKNIFAVQEEIAGLIAQNLSLKLGASSAVSTASVNPEAFVLYAQARQAWNLRTDEGLSRAEQLLTRALDLEPTFARAHSAMADVWSLQGQRDDHVAAFGLRNGPAAVRIAAKCKLALELDPYSAEAHASQGAHYLSVWRLADSEREHREAIRLNSSYASAHQWLGRTLLLDGRLDEALVELHRATELDPLSPRILDNYAWALIFAGRFEEAIRFCDRALGLQSTATQAQAVKAMALAQTGHLDVAVELARTLANEDSGRSMFRAMVLGLAGKTAEVEGALTGYKEGSHISKVAGLAALKRYDEALNVFDPSWMVSSRADFLLFHPIFDPMREDRRWQKSIATLGLTEAHARAQAWRAAHPAEKVETKK